MTDLVEALARALCIADRRDPDEDWTTDGVIQLDIALPEGEEQLWRTHPYAGRARAALSALEAAGYRLVPVEPTEKADPDWQLPAIVELNEKRPGIELLHLRGGAGYQTETLCIENGLGNGLRLLAFEDEWDEDKGEVTSGTGEIAHFHVTARSTARLIAHTLLEWADRIASPPEVPAAPEFTGISG